MRSAWQRRLETQTESWHHNTAAAATKDRCKFNHQDIGIQIAAYPGRHLGAVTDLAHKRREPISPTPDQAVEYQRSK